MNSSFLENVNLDYYPSRLRVLFILYFFSEPNQNSTNRNHPKIFETEVRIQKIDFLLRNPDYLAYEILSLVKENKISKSNNIKITIQDIFSNKEPMIRKQEMEKFFYGAYEDLDDIVAFLVAHGFIKYESEKNISGNVIEKKYYITAFAENKIKDGLSNIPSLNWYEKRCKLIKLYFGDLTGNELKTRQYNIQKYRETPWSHHIESIEKETQTLFMELFSEEMK